MKTTGKIITLALLLYVFAYPFVRAAKPADCTCWKWWLKSEEDILRKPQVYFTCDRAITNDQRVRTKAVKVRCAEKK